MNGYRVRFWNPKTRKGFIDGYRRAAEAKAAVGRYNDLYERLKAKAAEGELPFDGITAEYLGRAK